MGTSLRWTKDLKSDRVLTIAANEKLGEAGVPKEEIRRIVSDANPNANSNIAFIVIQPSKNTPPSHIIAVEKTRGNDLKVLAAYPLDGKGDKFYVGTGVLTYTDPMYLGKTLESGVALTKNKVSMASDLIDAITSSSKLGYGNFAGAKLIKSKSSAADIVTTSSELEEKGIPKDQAQFITESLNPKKLGNIRFIVASDEHGAPTHVFKANFQPSTAGILGINEHLAITDVVHLDNHTQPVTLQKKTISF